MQWNVWRIGPIIGTVLPLKQLYSIVVLLLSIQAIRSISTNLYWLLWFSIIPYASLRYTNKYSYFEFFTMTVLNTTCGY